LTALATAEAVDAAVGIGAVRRSIAVVVDAISAVIFQIAGDAAAQPRRTALSKAVAVVAVEEAVSIVV